MKALLALEDGRTFPCRSFTGPGETGGEVVFNTGMTGYQEILIDPLLPGTDGDADLSPDRKLRHKR